MIQAQVFGTAAAIIFVTQAVCAAELAEPSAAMTSTIAAGCAQPTSRSGHRFYVDPTHGSMVGNGSKQSPWRTLAEVFDVHNHLIANAAPLYIKDEGYIKPNPNAPVQPGDYIELLSGNHGNISMQGFFGEGSILNGYDNSSFITVEALPGQTPVIASLRIVGAGKWRFRGLLFESTQDVAVGGKPFTTAPDSVDHVLAALAGPNHDLIFDGNIFRSQADVSKWTVRDWLYKRASGLDNTAPTKCISIYNNRFYNIGFAIDMQRADGVLIKDNTIDMFADDGIDYGSNNLVIEGNKITNSIDDGDGFHRDAMQGQPNGEVPVENVTIRNNIVINQTKDLVAPGDLQGIDAFDGVWKNVTIANNIVATNDYHGITFFGIAGLKIINNTVVGTDNRYPTWIMVGPSKSRRQSEEVVIRNNIATSFRIDAKAQFDHNMQASLSARDVRSFKPSSHIIADEEPMSIFEGYNNSFYSYNFHLNPSRAIGTGSSLDAPLYGLEGAKRGNPPDLGAFVYTRAHSR